MHPYEVSQTLRTRAKDESIRLNFGSLYSVVESLEKRGFIVATETVREGKRPERTIYEITDAGKRELDRLALRARVDTGEGVPELRGRALAASRRSLLKTPQSSSLRDASRSRCASPSRRPPVPAPLRWACRVCSCSKTSTESASWRPSSTSPRHLLKEIEGRSLEGIEEWAGFHKTD